MPQSLDNRTQRDLNPLRKHLLPPPVSTTAHHKLPSGSLSTDSHRPPRALHSSTSEVGSTVHRQLVSYFRSGWAFLIPYLAAYLLYAWLKWPVNPAAGGEGLVKGMSESAGALPSTAWSSPPFTFTLTSLVPCLLHVYWTLHAINLVLGGLALRAWWRESGATVTGATDDSENTANHSATPQPLVSPKSDVGGSTDSPSTVHRAAQPLLSTVPLRGNHLPPALRHVRHSSTSDGGSSASSEVGSTVYRLLPWLLLALLFYIPGVYLEWPSDPREHLRRINEWHVLDTVTSDAYHWTWVKSSYFTPYSLLSRITGQDQIFWLNFYYTSICLLLCWQYYRLARACDISEHASMVFVLLQALLFGNNIFSFYRYYGISSSIYAQLGAVALTRIVLEAAKHPQLSLRSFFSLPCFISQLTAPRLPPALRSFAPSEVGSVQPPTVFRPPSSAPPSTVYRPLLSVLCLLPLIRYNHVQGLGIAGLGVGSVIIWRLIKWKRSAIGWLAAGAILLSIGTVLWYPRDANMAVIYQVQGWLNPWYGFNFFQPSSIVFERTLHILGAFGLLNLIVALWLLRRNHIAAWLTLIPLIALALPCVALPFAQIIYTSTSADNIVTFHRMLLAIPFGLAVVATISQIPQLSHASAYLGLRQFLAFLIIPMAIGAAMTIPIGAPNYNDPLSYNRTWNSLVIVPADLQRETSDDQTSPSSQSAYLSRHWAPQRNTTIKLTTP